MNSENNTINRSAVKIRRALSSVSTSIVDLVLPPQCLSCASLVSEPGRLCAACWGQADFITAPYCVRCGIPFPGDVEPSGDDNLDLTCGPCLEKSPPYDTARAALVFNEVGANLVHSLKYRDRQEGVFALANWMVNAGGNALQDVDWVVPVPLHYTRLIRRRYNQSLLLARAIAKITAKGLLVDGLKRIRRTSSQVGLSEKERRENVRGAFAANASAIDKLEGASVALVDDVFTTGATLSACCLPLRRAGVAKILALALTRTTD